MARKKIAKNISYDPKRKLYYVTLYYGKVEGKAKKETRTFARKRDAEDCLKKFEYEKSENLLPKVSDETVESWTQYCLEDVMRPKIEKTTYSGYKNISKKVIAELGSISLRKLSSKDIQMYLARLIDPDGKYKLSGNTAIKHLTFLKTVLSIAQSQEFIHRNPAYFVQAPKYIQPKISFYSPEQINRLFEEINRDTILKPSVYLAAMLGLRREEICGLKWESVDFDNCILYIRDARTIAGSEIVEKDAKSYHSTRRLYIDDLLWKKLAEVKEEQKKRSEMLGDLYLCSDLVVVNDYGKPVNPGTLSTHFHKCVVKHNLPHITLHGLRHSVASIANDAGMTQYDISKMLGHSSPAVTGKVYTHLFDELQVKTVASVANKIEENKQNDSKEEE
ncbi:MAG: site-specific integrase [Butyribacter sp.]|nr:site-specific integrase [bacterium]MDY3854501.1 site-specific integrase [Butyribacter sp.]